jgi:N-acetylmuramic acid 6-phosphate etherase
MKRRNARTHRSTPLIRSRGHLLTEQRNLRSMALDAMPIDRVFDLMNRENATVPKAVARAKPAIVRAIRAVSSAWRRGGRLIYIGAGTSGRLGVLDAAECPPTFRSDPKMVRGVIAGGKKALWRSVEGAEDDSAAAVTALQLLGVNRRDVVMGIATGGTTPYVHAALAEAKRRDATTVFFACVPRAQVKIACDIDIRVLTGPEVLSGSTRLKAGTATKLVLNTITTLGMVQIGKTYGNLMVDLNSYACRKLTERATRVVAATTGLSRPAALQILHKAHGNAKCAIVMHRRGLNRAKAEALLARCGGKVRQALDPEARLATAE